MKKHTLKYIILSLTFAMAISWGCKKSEETPTGTSATAAPQVISLTADKTEILYGGQDPTVITCVANGGSLSYKWDVDKGDIFPLKEDNSQVRFSGSPCCIGKKYIKCTVSNDKGSVLDTCIITIVTHKQ